MSVVTFQMKTHSRDKLNSQFIFINDCKVHNCKPNVWHIVSGKRKESYYLVECVGHDECGKLSQVSADHVVTVWNHYNPITPTP